MRKSLAVLIIEDVEIDAELVVHSLTDAGYNITFERVDNEMKMRAALDKQAWDIAILDFNMPELDGFIALEILRETRLDIPIIVVSGYIGEEIAVELMKRGAHDYVMKSNLARLMPAVEREISQAKVRLEHRLAQEQLLLQAQIIENSPVMATYFDKDLNIAWANKAFQKATGLSLEKIKGKKCYKVWNLSGPCRDCPVITAFETGENTAREFTPDSQDHCPKIQGYWLSEVAPLRDKPGAIIGAIEFAIDITTIKQAEEVLYQKTDELLRFQRVTVGRELKMIELKKEINTLLKQAGEPEKYRIADVQ